MGKTLNNVNFLDLVPGRKCNWDKNGEGKTFLLVPRFKNRWLKKFALNMGKSEFVRLYLDDNGARVWDLIDGQRTVGTICGFLREQLGDQPEQRVCHFMGMLKRNDFITLREDPAPGI